MREKGINRQPLSALRAKGFVEEIPCPRRYRLPLNGYPANVFQGLNRIIRYYTILSLWADY